MKIEKNVEVPRPINRVRYPFPEMEVGDSFVVSADKYISAKTSASRYGKNNAKTFVTRAVGDGTFRIWRAE